MWVRSLLWDSAQASGALLICPCVPGKPAEVVVCGPWSVSYSRPHLLGSDWEQLFRLPCLWHGCGCVGCGVPGGVVKHCPVMSLACMPSALWKGCCETRTTCWVLFCVLHGDPLRQSWGLLRCGCSSAPCGRDKSVEVQRSWAACPGPHKLEVDASSGRWAGWLQSPASDSQVLSPVMFCSTSCSPWTGQWHTVSLFVTVSSAHHIVLSVLCLYFPMYVLILEKLFCAFI